MSVEIYLVRHGIAADRGEYASDEERPLTEEGDRKTQKVAKQLQKLGLQFDIILTSPLVRARQTAKILQEANLSQKIEVNSALAPDGDIETWLKWLESWRQRGGSQLALVGHQPDLGNWAETLIWGEVREVLVLKKAGIIGISLPKIGQPIGNCQMFWLTPPKFLLKI
jgi:phosphohistidine phosphatase